MLLLKVYVIIYWYVEKKETFCYTLFYAFSLSFLISKMKKMEIALQFFSQNGLKEFYSNFENQQLIHLIAYEPIFLRKKKVSELGR